MVRIESLPNDLRTVPENPADWILWRDQALLWRVLMRDLIEHDLDARTEMLKLCADDGLFHDILFGAHYEPRDRIDRPKGWYPSIPFFFQALLWRWIDEVMANISGTSGALLGRSDGVVEKARDMTGSWTYAKYMGHRWLYDDGFAGGLMSYKEDAVENSNDTGTLFHKLEGNLGLDVRVPLQRPVLIEGTEMIVPVRSPEWLIPEGYDPKVHNLNLVLAHPTKTNIITGFTTTERTGTGNRLTMIVMDEAAKFKEFLAAWLGVRAVTDHAFALSSPDIRFGTGFRDVARHADDANQRGAPGPAFIRLRSEDHPFRDEIWREEIEARHAGIAEAADSLAREFDLDYEAGAGTKLYPMAQSITPKQLIYQPTKHVIDFTIDPGVRDRCAFHVVMYDPGIDRYGLLLSYSNNGKPAQFYASLLTASPLHQYYDYGEDEERVMDFFERYGRNIRFWVGDPAGKAKTGGHRDGRLTSFYDDLRDESLALSDGKFRVVIWSSDKHEYKRSPGRRDAMRWLLTKLDVNDAPDTRRTLYGIQEHRLKTERTDRETTFTIDEAIRHPLHDSVVALEYLAVHRRRGFTIDAYEPQEPIRVSMSGKPLTRSANKRRGYIK